MPRVNVGEVRDGQGWARRPVACKDVVELCCVSGHLCHTASRSRGNLQLCTEQSQHVLRASSLGSRLLPCCESRGSGVASACQPWG